MTTLTNTQTMDADLELAAEEMQEETETPVDENGRLAQYLHREFFCPVPVVLGHFQWKHNRPMTPRELYYEARRSYRHLNSFGFYDEQPY